ncbi:MAG TPA: FAD-dependent monooxygenase [Acidimicrobiales bacterium]|nr:FAD-dependent monooxygenase [Acidimicrobiales bacterium]
MAQQPDVAIVGAGIAGGALATALGRQGLDVLLLEQQLEYHDRVRGETMFPWGVAELRALGLDDLLLDAGGGYATALVLGDELQPADPVSLPLPDVVPGVPGQLNVGHPDACAALATGAVKAGARLVKGARDVVVTPGAQPSLSFTADGKGEEVAPRLVVGADGRASATRKACRLELHESEARVMLAGLLLGDATRWPDATNCMTVEGDWFVLGFPRPGNLVRLYAAYSVAAKGAFTGPQKVEQFMAVIGGLETLPGVDPVVGATPAGPLGAFPMTHTWMDEPFLPGVVLAGDAAGWSDPTNGQGLSVAMRDVHVLAEILSSDPAWDLRPYAEERRERMRRLRIALEVTVALRCDFTERGRARRAAFNEALGTDPRFLPALMVPVTGPAAAPPEAMTDELVADVRRLGAN